MQTIRIIIKLLISIIITLQFTFAAGPTITGFTPHNNSISSDKSQVIRIDLECEVAHDLYPDSARIIVNGQEYTNASPAVYINNSVNEYYLIFTPDSINLQFNNGDTVIVSLNSLIDSWGEPLENPQTWSFLVDLSPPVISGINPPPSSAIDSLNELTFNLSDSVGVLDENSIRFLFSVNNIPQDTLNINSTELMWQDSTLTYTTTSVFDEGDSLIVWIGASDSIHYGLSNQLDSTWLYYIAGGGPIAHIIEPLDSTITSETLQKIQMYLFDPNGIDLSSIELIITGESGPYPFDNSYFTYNSIDTTLIFDPSVSGAGSYFQDGDSIQIELKAVNDIFGRALQTPLSWFFTCDASPPQVASVSPENGATTYDIQQDISITIIDDYSAVDTNSIELVVNGTTYDLNNPGLSWSDPILIFEPEHVEPPVTFEGNLDVELKPISDLVDYGQPNTPGSSYSWSFTIASTGGPIATIFTPYHNAISSNSTQDISVQLYSASPMFVPTIRMTVNDSVYHVGGGLDFLASNTIYFYPDSNNITFNSGQFVTVSLDSTDDISANHLQNPQDWSFLIDKSKPVISNILPIPGSTLESLDTLSFNLLDNVGFIDTSSVRMIVTTNAVSADTIDLTKPELTWENDKLTYIASNPISEAAVITLNIFANDHIDFGPTNNLDTAWTYFINLEGPYATIVEPTDSSITSRTLQPIKLVLEDLNGLDSNSIQLTIDTTQYDISSPALSLEGDSLIFDPADLALDTFWSDGQLVTVSLDSVDDIDGLPLQNPLSWVFTVDLSGPIASNPIPANGYSENLTNSNISILLNDEFGMINIESIILTVQDEPFTLSDAPLFWDTDLEKVIFSPEIAGLSFSINDTVRVSLTATDFVHYGQANPLQNSPYSWYFIIREIGWILLTFQTHSQGEQQGANVEFIDAENDTVYAVLADSLPVNLLSVPTCNPCSMHISKTGYSYYRENGIVISLNDTTAIDVIFGKNGDYDADNDIDIDDLNSLVSAWYTNNSDILLEFGPATGTIPDLTVEADGVLDFEDLMIFTLMWNWWHENNPDDLTRTLWPDENIGPASVIVSHKKGKEENIVFQVITEHMTNFQSSQVILHYNPEELAFKGVQAGSIFTDTNPLLLKVLDAENGLLEIDMAHFSSEEIQGSGILAEIEFQSLLVPTTDIEYFYNLRERDGSVSKGIGVWEAHLIPEDYSVSQNYPNPFNPVTTFRYGLPEDTEVILTIYNLRGQAVSTLVNSNQTAGYHTVQWNASSVSSGIYFYHLTAGQYSKVRKCILLK